MKTEKWEKFAAGCRSLAADLKAGTGPILGSKTCFGDGGAPCCAIGHALHRAGHVEPGRSGSNYISTGKFVGTDNPKVYDHLPPEITNKISVAQYANDMNAPIYRQRAVILPLLDLAETIDRYVAKQLPNLNHE